MGSVLTLAGFTKRRKGRRVLARSGLSCLCEIFLCYYLLGGLAAQFHVERSRAASAVRRYVRLRGRLLCVLWQSVRCQRWIAAASFSSQQRRLVAPGTDRSLPKYLTRSRRRRRVVVTICPCQSTAFFYNSYCRRRTLPSADVQECSPADRHHFFIS